MIYLHFQLLVHQYLTTFSNYLLLTSAGEFAQSIDVIVGE